VVRPPGKEPGFHVFVPDIVPGFYLTLGLAGFRQHSFLIGNVGFDRVGDEKIRAAARGLGQLGESFLCLRIKPDAEGCSPCVRHEHILARAFPAIVVGKCGVKGEGPKLG